MNFGGKDHRGEMPVSSSYQEYLLSTWFIIADVNLHPLVEAVSVRLFDCKIIPPIHPVLWEKVTTHGPHLGRRGYAPPQGSSYLHTLFGMFLHRRFVYSSFIYSVIYIRMDSWIYFLYFGLYFNYYLILLLNILLFKNSLLLTDNKCLCTKGYNWKSLFSRDRD